MLAYHPQSWEMKPSSLLAEKQRNIVWCTVWKEMSDAHIMQHAYKYLPFTN